MPNHTLYRAIRRQRPKLGDFWSDFAHGDAPTGDQLGDPFAWASVSMFNDRQFAAEQAHNLHQGRFLIELVIPDTQPDVIVRQTGPDPRHFSVMGTPTTLLACCASSRGTPVDQLVRPATP